MPLPFALPVLSFGMKVGIFAGFVVALLVAWNVFINSVEERGATKAVAKIEKANKNAVKKADEVGRKSRDPAARGVRDPNYSGD